MKHEDYISGWTISKLDYETRDLKSKFVSTLRHLNMKPVSRLSNLKLKTFSILLSERLKEKDGFFLTEAHFTEDGLDLVTLYNKLNQILYDNSHLKGESIDILFPANSIIKDAYISRLNWLGLNERDPNVPSVTISKLAESLSIRTRTYSH